MFIGWKVSETLMLWLLKNPERLEHPLFCVEGKLGLKVVCTAQHEKIELPFVGQITTSKAGLMKKDAILCGNVVVDPDMETEETWSLVMTKPSNDSTRSVAWRVRKVQRGFVIAESQRIVLMTYSLSDQHATHYLR